MASIRTLAFFSFERSIIFAEIAFIRDCAQVKGESHADHATMRMTKKEVSMTAVGNEGPSSSQHITAGHCHVCGADRMLDARYDAIFCPNCLTWLEPACTDPGCEFCADRPRSPQVGGR